MNLDLNTFCLEKCNQTTSNRGLASFANFVEQIITNEAAAESDRKLRAFALLNYSKISVNQN